MTLKDLLNRNLTGLQLKVIKKTVAFIKSIGHGSNLTRLAKIYKTDKGGDHFYTPHYMTHFNKLKNKRISLLEIGVGGDENPKLGGASLRMWKRYFHNGEIFGIDVYDKSLQEENRIKIFKGSQIDKEFLIDVIEKIPEPDIIIDDGSHINEHVILTYKILFPVLKKGGIYVIEDVQTSYWPDYGGDYNNLENPDTIMNFFKGISKNLLLI
jgi:demethylmacrocin O-methyltransferase